MEQAILWSAGNLVIFIHVEDTEKLDFEIVVGKLYLESKRSVWGYPKQIFMGYFVTLPEIACWGKYRAIMRTPTLYVQILAHDHESFDLSQR